MRQHRLAAAHWSPSGLLRPDRHLQAAHLGRSGVVLGSFEKLSGLVGDLVKGLADIGHLGMI